MSFLSYLKDGISLGSIYAIIALGYTMVYGIAKMLNFAYRCYQRRHVSGAGYRTFCNLLYRSWYGDRESRIQPAS